jgi:signal transduction histidine kinase/CheY-like chemotaxis protein
MLNDKNAKAENQDDGSLTESINQKNKEIFQLKSVLDNIPGDIYWKDKNGVYLGINETGCESLRRMGFAWEKADIVGKTDYDLYPKETADEFRKNDLQVMQTGVKSSREEAAILPSGERIIQLSVKRPLLGEDGETIGVVGNTIDITYLKKIESDLRVAKALAESANKMKSEFIANMSHDVKTPLSGIIGLSELVSVSSKEETTQKFLKDVQACGQTLMNFFNHCLELSTLDNADVTLIVERFSLKDLVNEIVTLFTPAISHKGLALTVSYGEEVPTYFFGSRAAIYRVLQNLVGNAIKFTHEGSIDISIRAEMPIVSGKKDLMVSFSVNDTGIGIPADKQKVIFEKLTRLTPSYQGIYEGSGIGLYLVEKFITAMGGKITLESREGVGSKFFVTLPLKSVDLPVFSKQVITSTPPENNEDDLGLKSSDKLNLQGETMIRVLLVEDNEVAQKIVSILLNRIGCQVDIASTGAEAIESLEKTIYDLVYMDIGLPDMKGYEVVEKWRENCYGNIPIIALTAHADTTERELCFKSGIDGILRKPLLEKQAVEVIDKFIHKKDINVDGLLIPTN